MNKKNYNVFFLDRDGVVNTGNFVNTPEDFVFLPNAIKAFRLLGDLKKMVFIATNQGGIETGYLTEEKLEAIHDVMRGEIIKHGGWIHHIFHCPSIDSDHEDRKPNPGMILKGLENFNIHFYTKQPYTKDECCFIGDHLTDWQAAVAAGIDPIAVKSDRYWGYDAYKFIDQHNIPIYKSLYEAVETHAYP